MIATERRGRVTGRALIVDDQPANILLLERILQTGGYTNLKKTTDPRQVLEFFTIYQSDVFRHAIEMLHSVGFGTMTTVH